MKQKFFAIATIAVLAIVGVFVFEHATSAQRPDRNDQNQQRGNRQGGDRGARGRSMGMGMMNYVSIVDNSWLDLTFAVKVDDETLVKARPIYQATREKFMKKMEEIRSSDNMRGAEAAMQSFLATTGPEFQASLKEVLTEEQLTKLTELTKQRQERQNEQRERMNRFREGAGRRGGGGGNQ